MHVIPEHFIYPNLNDALKVRINWSFKDSGHLQLITCKCRECGHGRGGGVKVFFAIKIREERAIQCTCIVEISFERVAGESSQDRD